MGTPVVACSSLLWTWPSLLLQTCITAKSSVPAIGHFPFILSSIKSQGSSRLQRPCQGTPPPMHFCCSSETAWQPQLPRTPEGGCNPSLPTYTSVSRVPLGIHLVCETPLQQPGNQKGTVPLCRPLHTGLTQRGASLKTSVGTLREEAR